PLPPHPPPRTRTSERAASGLGKRRRLTAPPGRTRGARPRAGASRDGAHGSWRTPPPTTPRPSTRAPTCMPMRPGCRAGRRRRASRISRSGPEHWHADLRWAFWVQEPKVVLQAEEVEGYAWRPRTDAPTPKLVPRHRGRDMAHGRGRTRTALGAGRSGLPVYA